MGTHRVKAMFHSTAIVPDYDLAVERMGHLFGLRVLEYSEADDPGIGRRGGMTWIGDGSIEIGQPIVPGAPTDRFVHHTGGGMHSVGVWVEDFAATIEHLEREGVEVPMRRNGFGFSAPRDTEGLLLEWSGFTVDEDPRAGGQLPPLAQPPVVSVGQQAFVGAVVPEPAASARRLAALLGTRVTFEDVAADVGSPVVGLSLGDCTLALYALPAPDTAEALWGRRHERPGMCAIGVRVDDLAAARAALEAAGAAPLRASEQAVVLDRAVTGGIEVVVVEALLPGDPRAA